MTERDTLEAASLADSREMLASLAEACHVDGNFDRAAEFWSYLAGIGYEPAESLLKAAISSLASGDNAMAAHWFLRARRYPESRIRLRCVLAQEHWIRGRPLRALKTLSAIRHSASEAGPETTLLGVYARALRHDEQARRLFMESASNGDACGLCNFVSLSIHTIELEPAVRALTVATRRESHRFEPLVLMSRLARRFSILGDRDLYLSRARLRRDKLNQTVMTPPQFRSVLYAAVTGRLAADEIEITVKWQVQAGSRLPRTFLLNSSYQCVTMDGTHLPSVVKESATEYRIPTTLLHKGARSAEIVVRGVPTGPGCRVGSAELEMDAIGTWLPIPCGDYQVRWDLKLEASGAVLRESSGLFGATAIVLAEPVNRTEVEGIEVLGHAPNETLELVGRVVRRALNAWSRYLPPISPPSVIVVDRPNSEFCYSRPGLIRIASGAPHGRSIAQLFHKVSHLWWNAESMFSQEARWLAESLSEFALHLGEEAGHLRGYRKTALDSVRILENGALTHESLHSLGQMSGKPAAFRMRVKGGFVILALRRLLGEASFKRLLTSLFHVAKTTPIETYSFFALASRLHGASLNWFARQWVYECGVLDLVADSVRFTAVGAGYELIFVARCTGVVVPCSPVEYAVDLESGERLIAPVDLGLGFNTVRVLVPSRPVCIVPDPYSQWYATTSPCIVAKG